MAIQTETLVPRAKLGEITISVLAGAAVTAAGFWLVFYGTVREMRTELTADTAAITHMIPREEQEHASKWFTQYQQAETSRMDRIETRLDHIDDALRSLAEKE